MDLTVASVLELLDDSQLGGQSIDEMATTLRSSRLAVGAAVKAGCEDGLIRAQAVAGHKRWELTSKGQAQHRSAAEPSKD